MLEKQVHHKEIGDISLRKTRKAHNLRITVKPGKNVTVTVPLLVSWTEALKFVEIKKDWILESMEKMKDQNPDPTVFSPAVSFRGSTKAINPRKTIFFSSLTAKLVLLLSSAR